MAFKHVHSEIFQLNKSRVGPQQVIDNLRKELKIGPILGPKTAFLGVKRAL
jgi:hypothetical protein